MYNIIPVSSVPSEVSFSTANYIERKERSRLAPKTVNMSMLTRQMEILDKLLENKRYKYFCKRIFNK